MNKNEFFSIVVVTLAVFFALVVAVASTCIIIEHFERPVKPEVAGRFVPPAEATYTFADNEDCTFGAEAVTTTTENIIKIDSDPAANTILWAGQNYYDVLFEIEYEGDTIFYAPGEKEMLRLCANGDIYVREEKTTRNMTICKGFEHWLMKMGVIPLQKEEVK